MDGLCVIFGAGATYTPRKNFGKNALIIAADGGYAAATAAGLTPDVVVGDFDSGDEPKVKLSAHVIKLSCDKNDTDMMAAVKLGLRRGYRKFVLYGGVGGRLDHTAANFAALRYMNNFDAQGFLIDENAIATVITESKFALPRAARGTVSVFAYGGIADGVTYTGLTYNLKNATLTPDFPLGVSNATTAEQATIAVKSGSLLIFFPR